jgi:hypothetical protein
MLSSSPAKNQAVRNTGEKNHSAEICSGQGRNTADTVCTHRKGTHRERLLFGTIQKKNARDGIRTQELLRDQALNLAPLTWLGYPRACIDYPSGLINVREKKDYSFFDPLFSLVNFFISRSRSSFLRILPEMVLGRVSTYSIARGYLYGAVTFLTCSWISRVRGSDPL